MVKKAHAPKLVIRPHRPWARRVVVAVLAAAMAAAGWGLYRYGRYQVNVDYRGAAREQARLEGLLADARRHIDSLRSENARLETAQQVDRHANAEVRRALVQLQEENQELREELQFYRNIVSPSEAGSGVRIQHLGLEPVGGERMFRYTVTLIRIQGAKARSGRARGSVDLIVEGTQDGERKQLGLAEVASDGDGELSYSIKYFKKFQGKLQLPEGFVPSAALVRARPSGGRDSVEKKIQWPATTGRGG